MKRKLLLPFVVLSMAFTSCNEDDVKNNNSNENVTLENRMKDKRMQKFSEILSKAVYERQDVREFLKAEALKQFDNDYDVLYYLVKDNMISNETFRDVLVNYSSEEEITDIERNVPLLNILIPEISIFGVSAENLDVTDNETPVIYSNDQKTNLYLNGVIDFEIKKGEVPDFNTFVVNENDRVDANSIHYDTTSSKQSRNGSVQNSISFTSPYFDGQSQQKSILNQRTIVQGNELDQLVVNSYNYFNENISHRDNPKEKSYQRDYVYYGITNKNSSGRLKPNVVEYLDYITVNPSTYFRFNFKGDEKGNPTIQNHVIVNKRRPLSTEQLIDRMWTKGAYEFKFEIFSSSGNSTSVIIPIKPSEIWDFNVEYDRRHGSFWRRSRHTYKIDPNKFTSKVFRLNNMVAFTRWDIENESLNRFVSISEVNPSGSVTETVSRTVKKVAAGKFNASLKFGVGEKISAELGGEGSFSNETTSVETFSRTYNITDDVLGTFINVYFYDPIIVNKQNNNHELFYYSTGAVNFSVVPRIR